MPRHDLVPDPSLERDEMEALQERVRERARFEPELTFDPAALAGAAIDEATGVTESTAGDDGDRNDIARAPIVAGVDQAFLDDRAISAAVAIREGEVLARVHAETPLEVPYVPGYLSFREGPPILEAIEALPVEPDLYCLDGNGRLHPRQAGLATHVGVVLDAPTIGIAKGLLCGEPRRSLEGLPQGARVGIEATTPEDAPNGALLGYAVQTRQFDSPNRHVNPIYASPGHRVDAATAADLALALSSGYKLPDPIRLADAHADDVRASI